MTLVEKLDEIIQSYDGTKETITLTNEDYWFLVNHVNSLNETLFMTGEILNKYMNENNRLKNIIEDCLNYINSYKSNARLYVKKRLKEGLSGEVKNNA